MRPGQRRVERTAVLLVALFPAAACTTTAMARNAIELSDAQVENIVRRSYPYVAMYNVNNKFALDDSNPLSTGGWNELFVGATPADHTLPSCAKSRPTVMLPSDSI